MRRGVERIRNVLAAGCLAALGASAMAGTVGAAPPTTDEVPPSTVEDTTVPTAPPTSEEPAAEPVELTLSTTTPRRGDSITALATGCEPGEVLVFWHAAFVTARVPVDPDVDP